MNDRTVPFPEHDLAGVLQQLRMLGLASAASIAVYAGIGFGFFMPVADGQGAAAASRPSAIGYEVCAVLFALALGMAIASVAIPLHLRKRAAMSLAQHREPRQFLLALRTEAILVFAFGEAIAVLGLVAALVGCGAPAAVLLLGTGLLVIALRWPSRQRFEAALAAARTESLT